MEDSDSISTEEFITIINGNDQWSFFMNSDKVLRNGERYRYKFFVDGSMLFFSAGRNEEAVDIYHGEIFKDNNPILAKLKALLTEKELLT